MNEVFRDDITYPPLASEEELVKQKAKWINMVKNSKEQPAPEGKNVEGPCMIWQKTSNAHGYGTTGWFVNKTNPSTHRLSWQFKMKLTGVPSKTIDGDKLCVRHLCDVNLCIQPLHLNIGTSRENSGDMIAAETIRRGEKNPQSKLNDKMVQEIRLTVLGDPDYEGRGAKAKRFGISVSSLRDVENFKTWFHVPDKDGKLHDRSAADTKNSKNKKKRARAKSAKWDNEKMEKARIAIAKNVSVSEDMSYNDTACDIWTGGINDGYGVIYINGQQWRTHRLSLALVTDMVLLSTDLCRHLCNNKLCCKSSHLAWGDDTDNMHDISKSGGWSNAKINSDQALEMRKEFASGEGSVKSLSVKYGLSESRARKVINGEGFAHVAEKEVDDAVKLRLKPKKKAKKSE